MNTLPQTFTKSGFEHSLFSRTGDVAIYRRNRVGSTRQHFEVIRVQRHKEFVLLGKSYPAGETYPTAESWGTKGWTCSDLPRAVEKANELLN